MDDLVSVILPVYNRSNLVTRAIRSVLQQDYTKWELIVVDDGSTDGLVTVVEKFSDERVNLIRLAENGGPANARNQGIRASKGEYISFLDSDDEYDPSFLKESVKRISERSGTIGFIWTGLNFINPSGKSSLSCVNAWKPARQQTPYHALLHGLHIGIGCGITVKREVFDQVGLFDSSLKAAEDTDFFLRAVQHFSFDYIDKPLIKIHKDGSDRLSRDFRKAYDAYKIILPKHSPAIDQSKALRLKYNYKMLWLSYHSGFKHEARRYFVSILKDRLLHVPALTVFMLFELLGQRIGARLHLRLSMLK